MDNYDKLARILRTKPEVLKGLADKMQGITGKEGVIQNVIEENDLLIGRTLKELGIDRNEAKADDIYNSLIERLSFMDKQLFEFLGKPDLRKMSPVCGRMCDTALELSKPGKGFFIKKEKAIEMLESHPPQNLLDHFGYSSVAELVKKEGFASVFSSLRFAQDNEWMHKFFDEPYKDLTPDDFEERDVEVLVLDTKWLDVAEKFMKKKYHNLSHLKEYGIIFITPITVDAPGETMRMFTLLFHYLNEVPFYSRLFRHFAGKGDEFIPSVQSLLRGDVSDEPTPQEGAITFRIIQRYLAKDDENDFRLFEPHVNPEAEHWYNAEGDLGKLTSIPGAEGHAYGYWQGLDFVGDFFKENGGERLVSFDLIDLAMSLVKKGTVKYLYHQEEALWNKIFIEYLGRDKLNELIEENLVRGFITL
ncbi:MAG: hypothetical protein ABH833_02330 [Parcubacteria group bacterium]